MINALDVILVDFYKQVVRGMVFNATFNNISVIWWRSILLVEETGVPGENHGPVASHWLTLNKQKYILLPNTNSPFNKSSNQKSEIENKRHIIQWMMKGKKDNNTKMVY